MGDDDPEDRGGSANIFRREWCGREVAVKVPRVNSQQLQEMTEVSHHLLVFSRGFRGLGDEQIL